MTETFYRKERQPDGSIITRSKAYNPEYKNCLTCEYCKKKDLENNKEVADLLICKLKNKVLGYSYILDSEEYFDYPYNPDNVRFKPLSAECKSSYNNYKQTDCSEYMPYGWHIKYNLPLTDEGWVL